MWTILAFVGVIGFGMSPWWILVGFFIDANSD